MLRLLLPLCLLGLSLADSLVPQGASTYKLLKKYGKYKLNEACYGEENFKIWSYHKQKAEETCKSRGFTVKSSPLPYIVGDFDEKTGQMTFGGMTLGQGQGQQFDPSRYQQMESLGFAQGVPAHRPSSTVDYIPNGEYYPYQKPTADQTSFSVHPLLAAYMTQQAIRQRKQESAQQHFGQPSVFGHHHQQQQANSGYFLRNPRPSTQTDIRNKYELPAGFQKHVATGQAGFGYNPLNSKHAAGHVVEHPRAYEGHPFPNSPSHFAYQPNDQAAMEFFYKNIAVQKRNKRQSGNTGVKTRRTKPTAEELKAFDQQKVSQMKEEYDQGYAQIMGQACVLGEMGYLNADNTPNVAFIKEEIKALKLEEKLTMDLLESIDGCHQLYQTLPSGFMKHSMYGSAESKPFYFFACKDKLMTRVCLKHDVTASILKSTMDME